MAPAPAENALHILQLQSNEGEDECGPNIVSHKLPLVEYEKIGREKMLEKLRIASNEVPMYPRFANPEERLRSFEHWPAGMPVSPKDLCDAGFFYSSQGDRTFCYQCGGMLEGWCASDNTWNEHAKWYPDCKLVSSFRSMIMDDTSVQRLFHARAHAQENMKEALTNIRELVSSIDINRVDTNDMKSALETLKVIVSEVDTAARNNSSVPENHDGDSNDQHVFTQEVSESSSSNPSLSCLICLGRTRDALLLPCRHIATCWTCASKLKNCCVCRKKVEHYTRVYIS